jgi:class 3 adenylate cyclase
VRRRARPDATRKTVTALFADLVGSTHSESAPSEALNVASRIEHACRPGQVTVGEDTWRLTRGEFGYEALGEVTVAGRATRIARVCWRL